MFCNIWEVLLNSEKHRDFLTNTVSQDCLSGLAMLSVKKVMTENIIKFNDKTIDKSANHKGRTIDFS